MRAATMGVTHPSRILTKIALEVGIDPKPGHEVSFRQVISEKVCKTERKVQFWPNLKKYVFQFLEPLLYKRSNKFHNYIAK